MDPIDSDVAIVMLSDGISASWVLYQRGPCNDIVGMNGTSELPGSVPTRSKILRPLETRSNLPSTLDGNDSWLDLIQNASEK